MAESFFLSVYNSETVPSGTVSDLFGILVPIPPIFYHYITNAYGLGLGSSEAKLALTQSPNP